MSEKARNLQILAEHGVDVPAGFCLGAEHYQAAIHPLIDKITALIPDSAQIESLISGVAFPDGTMDLIQSEMAQLADAKRFAVRSSGAVVGRGVAIREDSKSSALAGQFDSYLNVKREQVPQAVRRCWASLFNERSVHGFGADRDYVALSTMSVVIQEMVPAHSCAVMMTCDPAGDGATGALEFSWGPCEAIVSGIVNPDEAIFHRRTGAVISIAVGSKAHLIQYGVFAATGDNAIKQPTAPEARACLSLSPDLLATVIALGQRIERIFNFPQDIELVVTESGRIVVTQSRAITRLPATYVSLMPQLYP